MFHQVYVPDEHCDFLRFLWWPEGYLKAVIQEYQMTVHLFVQPLHRAAVTSH